MIITMMVVLHNGHTQCNTQSLIKCDAKMERTGDILWAIKWLRKTSIPLFVKTPKNIFSYGIFQYDQTVTYLMSFNASEVAEYVLHH